MALLISWDGARGHGSARENLAGFVGSPALQDSATLSLHYPTTPFLQNALQPLSGFSSVLNGGDQFSRRGRCRLGAGSLGLCKGRQGCNGPLILRGLAMAQLSSVSR